MFRNILRELMIARQSQDLSRNTASSLNRAKLKAEGPDSTRPSDLFKVVIGGGYCIVLLLHSVVAMDEDSEGLGSNSGSLGECVEQVKPLQECHTSLENPARVTVGQFRPGAPSDQVQTSPFARPPCFPDGVPASCLLPPGALSPARAGLGSGDKGCHAIFGLCLVGTMH